MLLARGDKFIDVALAHGYASQTAFAAVFRRRFGSVSSRFSAMSARCLAGLQRCAFATPAARRAGACPQEKPNWYKL